MDNKGLDNIKSYFLISYIILFLICVIPNDLFAARPMPADLSTNMFSGPSSLAPGETATYTNQAGQSITVTMPEDVSGITLTSVNASIRIRSTNGYWKIVENKATEVVYPTTAQCVKSVEDNNYTDCPPPITSVCGVLVWGGINSTVVKGTYRITGRTNTYYYGGNCINSPVPPWNTISNYGLPCPEATTEVCNQGEACGGHFTLSGSCIGREISISKWESNAPDPAQNLGEKGCNTKRGNPVNVATGNKFQKENDIPIGQTPMALSFSRYYNSQDNMLHRLGYGWSHTYSLHLSFTDDAYPTTLAWRKDGRAIIFRDDDFKPEKNINEKLEYDSENSVYVLTLESGIIEKYNTDGKLLSISDLNGNTQTLSYYGTGSSHIGLLERVTDPFGKTIIFEYNTNDLIEKITDPAGESLFYQYTNDDNLEQVTYQNNKNRIYHYEDTVDAHNLTGITNENNIRYAFFEYDDNDRAISSRHAGDADKITINRISTTKIEVSDANSNVSTYDLMFVDGITYPKKISGDGCTSCGGNTQTVYLYDNDMNIKQVTKKGVTTDYTYDNDNNILTKTIAKGTANEKITTYTYYPDTNKIHTKTIPSLTEGQQSVTTYEYDASWNITNITKTGYSITQAFSHTTTLEYNTRGQLTEINGPLTGDSDVTSFVYNQNGNLTETSKSNILTTIYSSYNAYGKPEIITDPNSVSTVFAYDKKGRLKTITTDAGTTTYLYDDTGNILSIQKPDGAIISSIYNNVGRLTKVRDIPGNSINYAYDLMGNILKQDINDINENLMKTVEYEYDANNRLLRTNYPDGNFEELTYDTHGNIFQIFDSGGGQVDYQYDTLNRVIQQTQKISDTSNAVTTYTYDTRNNLISVTDANNNQTLFVYDDSSRLIEQTSPDTGTTQFAHDIASNQSTKTFNDGTAIDYNFDALGRLTLVDYADDSENITYQYDLNPNGMGRLSSIIDPSGTYEYTYDTLGRLITEEKTLSSTTYLTQYTYDDANNLLSITYPSGRTISYDRNSSARITQVTSSMNSQIQSIAQNITHVPFGPIKSFDFANGKSLDTNFDLNYQPKTISVANVMDNTYALDNAGNVEQITDNIGFLDQSFIYNDKYELTNAQGNYGTFDFTYDPVGNRNTQTLDLDTQTYAYLPNTNKLDDITGTTASSYGYNLNGCIETKDTRTFEYTSDNRLKTVRDNGTIIAQYQYNSMGQRVTKTVNSITTVFLYDIFGNLIAESTDTGNTIKEYVYLASTPLAMFVSNADAILSDADADGDVDGLDLANISTAIVAFANSFGSTYTPEGSIYFYHTDHLGTPKALTDMTGQIVWQAGHSPFGTADITISSVENNLRFPGQYMDEETGLHYNWHRYYDPMTGRYLTPDPIGLAGGINPFVYTENNPTNYIDPEGLNSFSLPFEGYIPPIGHNYEFDSYGNAYMSGTYIIEQNHYLNSCMLRCLSDMGIMLLPILNLSPVDFQPLGYLANDTNRFVNSRLWDAAGSVTSAGYMKYNYVYVKTGAKAAKVIAKVFYVPGLAFEVFDAKEDFEACKCRCPN